MEFPVILAGPSAQSRSKALSNQRTVNLYPEKGTGKSQFVLNSFPGEKAFSIGNGPCRGAFVHKNVLYQVSGSSLYTVDTSGVRTNRGAITGSARCIFDGILDSVVVVANGTEYEWTGSALNAITDVDLEPADSCTHLNNQMIFDGNDGNWCSSDVGDASSISGLNYAAAESKADDMVRVKAFKQRLYLLGTETIEPWWNDGIGNPPFSRIEGGIIPVGLAALHSVADNDNYLYWLGDDKNIYALQAPGAYQRVSTIEIANQLESFATVSDAEGHTFTFQGQNFYAITFPNEGKSFCLNENVGPEAGWFELESNGGRYIHSAHVYFNGKNYVTDYHNGNIYELNKDTYDEFGDEIVRYRQTAPIHGEQIGAAGKELIMNRFELLCETGVGLVSGQGSDPVVMLDWSDDGGRTWSTEQWHTIGKVGDFLWRMQWFGLGSFHSRIIRIKMSDPVYYCLHSGVMDLEVGL